MHVHYSRTIGNGEPQLFSRKVTTDTYEDLGLFLGSGTTVARAGPGGAIIGYALMGTVVSATMSCLGEMTALLPVNAPMMELPTRFLDRGVGFAIAWMYW